MVVGFFYHGPDSPTPHKEFRLFDDNPHLDSHPATTPSWKLIAVNMGRVRTKTVKKSAKVIIERYYPKLTLDFETNKRICDEIAIISSKRLRNKVGILITAGAELWC